jgi:hypothetical protein
VKRRHLVSACVPLHLRLQKRMPHRGHVYLQRARQRPNEPTGSAVRRFLLARVALRAALAGAPCTAGARGTHGAWKPQTEQNLRRCSAARGGPTAART